jgi:hypothetical protein
MKRSAAVLVAAIALAAGLSAQTISLSNVKGVAFNYSVPGLTGLPVPTGADIQYGLPVASIDDHPFTAVVRFRGAWEDLRLLRNPTNGEPIKEPLEFDGSEWYYAPNFQWALGATQSFAQRPDGQDLVDVFAFYRGRYDQYQTSNATTVFTDMKGLFGTSFLAGLAYDSTAMDSRRVYSGVYAELSAEYGPGAINTDPYTDFCRFDLKVLGYEPLFSTGQGKDASLNAWSLYLAGYASADYAFGNQVPIWVMQTFGGRDLNGSLGDCVRGYPTGSYDTSFKAVGNGEVRLIGPALFDVHWLVPMAYLFVDAGCYSGFANDMDLNANASGTILSSGVGLNLDIFDFAYVGAYCGLKFPQWSSLYSTYTSTGPFFWNIQFLLQISD